MLVIRTMAPLPGNGERELVAERARPKSTSSSAAMDSCGVRIVLLPPLSGRDFIVGDSASQPHEMFRSSPQFTFGPPIAKFIFAQWNAIDMTDTRADQRRKLRCFDPMFGQNVCNLAAFIGLNVVRK